MKIQKCLQIISLIFSGLVIMAGLILQKTQWGLGIDPAQAFLAPSGNHLFGTDSLGRDLLARILVGSLFTLTAALGAVFISSLISVFFGTLAGWLGGFFDRIFMRATDLLLALPSLLLSALLAFFFLQQGLSDLVILILTLSLTRWMSFARLVRARVFELKERPFFEAATALGGNQLHIFKFHLLPHLKSFVLLNLAVQFPSFLVLESFLSFIGVGAQSPGTSWGLLIGEGWKYMATMPNLILAPSGFLFVFLLSIRIGFSWIKSDNKLASVKNVRGLFIKSLSQ